MATQSISAQVLPELWINGLVVTNDVFNPTYQLDISAGMCRDSNNVMDITLGSPNFEGQVVQAPLIISTLSKGVNGLDVGTIAASTGYSVYIIAASNFQKPTAAIITLSTNAFPMMPNGYDSYRLIGFCATDSGANILKMVTSGTSNARLVMYTVSQTTAVVGTVTTSYVALPLTTLVPAVANTPVIMQYTYAANGATDSFQLAPYNLPYPMVNVQTGVTTVVSNTVTIISELNGTAPTILYKATSASDSLALYVNGFWMFL